MNCTIIYLLGIIDIINTTNINYEANMPVAGFNTYKVEGREFDYLGMNNKHRILSNPDVRRAINYRD